MPEDKRSEVLMGGVATAFNWFVGALTPAYAHDVSTTISCSDGHCPAVILKFPSKIND